VVLKSWHVASALGLFSLVCFLSTAQSSLPAAPGQPRATVPATAPQATQAKPLIPLVHGRLEAQEPSQAELRQINQVRNGDADALSGEARSKLIRKLVQWYVYRFTWPETYSGEDPQRLQRLFAEATASLGNGALLPRIADLGNMEQRARQIQYLDELGRELALAYEEVMKNPNVVVRTNAMRLAAKYAEHGLAHLAPALTQVVAAGGNDYAAAQHWAIRALGELYDFVHRPSNPNFFDAKVMEESGRRVYEFLEHTMRLNPMLLQRMSEEEKDAVRFVRRAAIRTLGSYGRPAVVDSKDPEERKASADLLLEILTNDPKVSPSPSWWERTEAASALLNLRPSLSRYYQPDLAVHEVAKFAYLLSQQAAANPGKEHWIYYAWLLLLRIDENQRAETALAKELKKNTYYTGMAKVMGPAMENVVKPSAAAAKILENLGTWIEKNTPKKPTLWPAGN